MSRQQKFVDRIMGKEEPIVEPVPKPVARRLSDEAARAAQHVIDLENANAQLTDQVNSFKNMLHISEESNKELRGQVLTLKEERDYYHDRAVTIQANLTTAGKIILDVLKESPPALPVKEPETEKIERKEERDEQWGSSTSKERRPIHQEP